MNPLWPTPDGVIPFRLFYMMLSVSDNLSAREELDAAHATALGHALAENGKSPKVKRAKKNLTRRAFPEVNL